jgi:hypothetical protein
MQCRGASESTSAPARILIIATRYVVEVGVADIPGRFLTEGKAAVGFHWPSLLRARIVLKETN